MDGIILAGGIGKRMRPLTNSTPKPMLLVQGKPILEWSLLSLRPTLDRVLVVVAYLKEQIVDYMRQQSIFEEYQIVEQLPKPLGTGHALQCCRPFLHSNDFMVVNGDDLYSRRSLEQLAKTNAGIMTIERYDASRWGVLVCNESGSVNRIHEKPPDDLYPLPVLVNTGAYKLKTNVFEVELPLSQRGEYEITDAVTSLARIDTVIPVKTDFWVTIGTPNDYAAAQQLDLNKVIILRSG